MSGNVVPIAPERVEIMEIAGADRKVWQMLALAKDGDEILDVGVYSTRERAVALAETWDLPIVFVGGQGR